MISETLAPKNDKHAAMSKGSRYKTNHLNEKLKIRYAVGNREFAEIQRLKRPDRCGHSRALEVLEVVWLKHEGE